MEEKEFADPPLAARPTQRLMPIRSRPGTLSAESYSNPTVEDIARLKELGFGGVSTQLADEGYLDNEAAWQALRAQLAELRRFGMRAWIRDERGRPSGKAAGKAVARHPAGRASGLLHASAPFEGPGEAHLSIPAGELVALSAVPVVDNRLDLATARVLVPMRAGLATTELPAGQWLLCAFVERAMLAGTFANDPTAGEEPYINIMDQRAVEAYIEVCHERHRERIGEFFGDVVSGFHSDEPLLITAAFPSGRPFPPHPALPWLDDLPGLFRSRCGYDLLPVLPALFHEAGPDTAVVRCDFYRLVGELCGQVFAGTVGGWCRLNGLTHKLQSLGEESLVAQTAFEGSLSSFLGRAGLPCADLLSGTPETFRGRDQALPAASIVSSAAFHHGCTDIEADFADAYQYRAGLDVPLDQLRASIGWLFATGATSLNSLCIWKKRDPGDWIELTAFAGRLALGLRGSRHVADLALLCPLSSVWADYVPSTRFIMEPPIGGLDRPRIWSEIFAAASSRWDLAFRELAWELLDRQRDFGLACDRELDGADLDGPLMRIGAASYRAVVVPPMDAADPDTLALLGQFARGGGLVVGFHPWPSRSVRRGRDARAAAVDLFGGDPPPGRGMRVKPIGAGRAVLVGDREGFRAALDAWLEPEIRLEPHQPGVAAMHRRRDDEDVFVFANTTPVRVAACARLRCAGQAEIWDPASGAVAPAAQRNSPEGGIVLDLMLPARSSLLVIVPRLQA